LVGVKFYPKHKFLHYFSEREVLSQEFGCKELKI